MAEVQHTPGPWRVNADAGHPWVVEGPTNIPGIYAPVCEAGYRPNAHLIAAAPESHEANREAADFLRSYFGPVASDDPAGWSDDGAREVYEKLSAAIAKVEAV